MVLSKRTSLLVLVAVILITLPRFSSAQQSEQISPRQVVGQVDEKDADEMRRILDFVQTADPVMMKQWLAGFDVTVEDSKQWPFDRYLLVYLYFYFAILQPDVSKPIVLHMSYTDNPRLVERDDEDEVIHLYFGSNASEGLITRALDVADKASPMLDSSLQLLDEDEIETIVQPKVEHGMESMIIDFSNTLFEQLTEAIVTKNQLVNYIESTYNLSLEVKEGDFYDGHTIPFRRIELLMLVKVLSDLSKPVVDLMQLKRLVRLTPGLEIGRAIVKHRFVREGKVAAHYDPIPGDETIYFSDHAFEDGLGMPSRLQGEGVVMHEFGHALWYGIEPSLQLAFQALSWRWVGDDTPSDGQLDLGMDGWELMPLKTNFARLEFGEQNETPYSMTSLGEDFAEHFALFMHRPERLYTQVRDKFDFFKKRIFPRSWYGTRAHRKMTIVIGSEKSDVLRPWLVEQDPAEALKIDVKDDPDDPNYVRVVCTVTGLFDDVSGIKNVCVLLLPDKKNNATESLSLNLYGAQVKDFCPEGHCVDEGRGIYQREFRFHRDRLFAGSYWVNGGGIFSAYDKSRRSSQFYAPAERKLDLGGKRGSVRKEVDSRQQRPGIHALQSREAQSQIKIENLGTMSDAYGEIFRVTLPLGEDDLARVDFRFLLEDGESSLYYRAISNFYRKVLDDGRTAYDIIFPKNVGFDRARLGSLRLGYPGTKTLQKREYPVDLPDDLPNLRFAVDGGAADVTRPDVLLDAVEIWQEVVEKNAVGGKNIVHVKVPISGVELENWAFAEVKLLGPNGDDYTADNWNSPVVERQGQFVFLSFKYSLPLNPPDGSYMLGEIQLEERLNATERRPEGTVLWSKKVVHSRTIKIVERQIRREIFVGAPEKD